MAINATELITESRCYGCYGAGSTAQMLTLALESRILLEADPAADTSAATLISYAKCYGCYGLSLYDMMEVALLDMISQT